MLTLATEVGVRHHVPHDWNVDTCKSHLRKEKYGNRVAWKGLCFGWMQQMSSCDYCSGVDNETRSARLVILGRVFELDDNPPHCRVRIPFGRVGNNLRSRTSGELSFIKEPFLTDLTQLAAHLCFYNFLRTVYIWPPDKTLCNQRDFTHLHESSRSSRLMVL